MTEIERLREALEKAEAMLGGLMCLSCKAQGAEMAEPGKCCRDVDCDAGWYGIHCDEVATALTLARAALAATPPGAERGGGIPSKYWRSGSAVGCS